MSHYTRPVKGCSLIATESHPFHKAGDIIGQVEKVDGNILLFKDRQGDTDRYIWRFKDGNNKFISFGA